MLKLLRNGSPVSPSGEAEKALAQFCSRLSEEITLEWIDGQYWLHSDVKKENPITIQMDAELQRHEEYFRHHSVQKELLAKAIGVKGPYRPRVVDLSAGLLGDTLLFLSFGCEVIAVERNPIIAFLIQSAIANARHPVLQNLKFQHMRAQDFLLQDIHAEVLYFDPMFEDANSKTAPRKEMRIFRSLIGEDEDAKEVWEKALERQLRRVVVKRPRLSKALGEKTPLQYVGKATRYDVYLS